MDAYILASGRTKTEYFKTFSKPKCLYPLDDKTTILDFQIEKFRKFGLNPVVFLGYKKDEILSYRSDFESIIDHNWNAEYTITRVLSDNKSWFKFPCIITFSDIIFEDRVIQLLLDGVADMVIEKTRSIIKINQKGFDIMLDFIDNYPYHKGWEPKLWTDMEWRGVNIQRISQYLFVEDIDRDEETNRFRNIYNTVK